MDDERAPFPEPTSGTAEPAELFLRQLDYLRDLVLHKVASLDEPERRDSRVPSGWSPLELAWHLAFMERRWIVWGFLGRPVEDPWGDHAAVRDDDAWLVPDDIGLEEVRDRMARGAEETRAVLRTHPMDAVAARGGRFGADDDTPTLASICHHVVAEYARHAGQLDVAVELAGGHVGE